jgi:hypothetical protein
MAISGLMPSRSMAFACKKRANACGVALTAIRKMDARRETGPIIPGGRLLFQYLERHFLSRSAQVARDLNQTAPFKPAETTRDGLPRRDALSPPPQSVYVILGDIPRWKSPVSLARFRRMRHRVEQHGPVPDLVNGLLGSRPARGYGFLAWCLASAHQASANSCCS